LLAPSLDRLEALPEALEFLEFVLDSADGVLAPVSLLLELREFLVDLFDVRLCVLLVLSRGFDSLLVERRFEFALAVALFGQSLSALVVHRLPVLQALAESFDIALEVGSLVGDFRAPLE